MCGLSEVKLKISGANLTVNLTREYNNYVWLQVLLLIVLTHLHKHLTKKNVEKISKGNVLKFSGAYSTVVLAIEYNNLIASLQVLH